MRRCFTFFVLILLLGWLSVFSQSNSYLFQNYTTAEGLPNNYIRATCQDHNGYLWVGTRHGLSKFDGYGFTNYDRFSDKQSDPPYPSGLFEDSSLKLWVLNHNLVYTFEPGADRFNLVRDSNTVGMYDHSGNLWIPFIDGIYRIDAKTLKEGKPSVIKLITREHDNKFAVFEKIAPYQVKPYATIYNPKPGQLLAYNELGFSLLEDTEGMIWCLVHSDGVYKLNPQNGKFIHYEHKDGNDKGLSHNIVNVIFEDADKSFWFGTENGIDILEKDAVSFKHVQNSIYEKYTISNNKITTLLKDRTGNLWVGTKYGLNRLIKSKFSYVNNFNKESTFLSNNVISLFEDNRDKIWVSTSLAVEILDENLKNIDRIPVQEYSNKLLNAAPQYIYQDRQGKMWIGTWMGGLVQYNSELKKFEYFRHDKNNKASISGDGIFHIFEDSGNKFWISFWTGNGIDLFDREKKIFRNFNHVDGDPKSLSASFVSMVLEDHNATLWVGTSSGLNMIVDKNQGVFRRFIHKEGDSTSISGDFIDCIFESSEKELWIGTDGGLNKYSYKTGTFVSFDKKNEFPKEEILGILEDDAGNLWISTSHKISKIILDKSRSKIAGIQSFDFRKINTNEFNVRACLKQKNGTMLFGGLNGIVYFRPELIRQNLTPPRTIITRLKIFNKEVNIGDKFQGRIILTNHISETDKIELSYKQSAFTIEFVGLHFENSEANQYKFKLEGSDNDWTYTDATSRSASYRNLPGGRYVFKVMSANSDGIWNENPTVLSIRIIPPFWKTIWFLILFYLMIAGIIALAVRTRIYFLKKQREVLQKLVTDRTQEIVRQKENIELQNELLEVQKVEILEQSAKIERANQLLQKHNIELVDSIKEVSEARVMQKLIDFNEFRKIFKNEDDCYKLLVDLKWADGFICKRCKSNENGSKDPYEKRCKKCNYKESVTSFTIFHHLRFPIEKALYILILTNSGKDINISQLSSILALRLKTCWSFHNKVKLVMSQKKRSKNSREGWIELILQEKKEKKPV
jgi:ligand-binding sensor domain-containing protein